jgi:hypothetical protein
MVCVFCGEYWAREARGLRPGKAVPRAHVTGGEHVGDMKSAAGRTCCMRFELGPGGSSFGLVVSSRSAQVSYEMESERLVVISGRCSPTCFYVFW